MEQAWNRYAFIRFVLFMAIGIASATFLPSIFDYILVAFPTFCALYIFSQLFRGYKFPAFHSVSYATLAFLICFSFGFLNAYQSAEKYDSEHLLRINSEKIEAFEVILLSDAKNTSKTFGFKAKIKQIYLNQKWQNYSGKVMLYFQIDSSSNQFKYGDQIVVSSSLTELQDPKNPDEFNYKRYLSFDQIYHQQYVRSGKWERISEHQGNILIAASLKTSHYLEAIMNQYIRDGRSLAIAKALTLGIKDELDNDLRDAYAAAGAMHVLAVSGLHVGIIFLITSTLLKSWRNRKYKRFIFAVINISVLWSYAFITGLPPSVQRAAMMFTFIILAQTMRRQTNIYNTLAASAFILLCIDPFLIFSVGFQLSYLAVLGIVFLQPRLYTVLQFKFILWDKIWAITCVSIAAQLATAPLAILYFHQFPTYFFLSNLVVIPAAFVILNGSLFLLAISFWNGLAEWIGLLLDYFIQFINSIVFTLEYLPKNTIEHLYINGSESWLIYIALFLTALFITTKKLSYFKWTVITLSLVSASICWRQYQNFQAKTITVYDTGKQAALAFKNGFTQHLRLDSTLSKDQNKLLFHVYPSQLKAGLTDFSSPKLQRNNESELFKNVKGLNLTVCQNKKIVHWDQPLKADLIAKVPLEIDFLIISNNAVEKADRAVEFFKAKKIIVDASNSYYNIQNLKAKFESEKQDYYLVSEKGAFEWKL